MRTNQELAQFAKKLRIEQTDAEALLWQHLRSRQMAGYKFRRQRVVGQYVADFVCLEAKLVIELDGSQHMNRIGYDRNRSEFFGSRGYRVLRYWNNQLFDEMDAVLEEIQSCLPLTPTLSP